MDLVDDGEIPVYSSDTSNNGIIGYTNREAEFIVSHENPIYLVFGDHTRSLNIVFHSFNVTDNVKVLSLKDSYSIKILLYIISSWQKGVPNLGYSRHWSIAKKVLFKVPVKNGVIDFAFMENFIAELEAERIAELEAYLRVTGLSDYILTEEERAVLEAFRNGKISWGGVKLLDKQQVKDIEWRVFRMEDVLEWQPQKEIDPLKLDKLKDKNQKLYPFYGQATLNNGIISYNQLVEEVLNNKEGKPTILIHSNNQNTIYLESPFYLKDGHGATSVLQSKKLNKLNALYFMSSIKKVILSKYSYNAKATKIELKNTLISLPSVQGKPLYDYMEVFIRAVQKLVIKDVVQYAERKVAATRAVVK